MITIDADGKTAYAETYFTGIHFGKGKWTGQQVTAWGKYKDMLERSLEPHSRTIHGASGYWKISSRETTFMGRLGEEGVMGG